MKASAFCFVFLYIIWILGLSVLLGELTTVMPPECCYCTPLLRYTSLFVQTALYFDSVIVHVCKFSILQKCQHLTKVQHLRHSFIFRPALPNGERPGLKFKHTRAHTQGHICVCYYSSLWSHKGDFFHAKNFPSCLNARWGATENLLGNDKLCCIPWR